MPSPHPLKNPLSAAFAARLRLALTLLSWLYLALLLILWALFHFYGDILWLPTVLLFAPRWPYALPLIVLVPAAILSLSTHRSQTRGQRSETRDQKSEARGQRSETRGQRSEARSQRPETRDQNSRAERRHQRTTSAPSRSLTSDLWPLTSLPSVSRLLTSLSSFLRPLSPLSSRPSAPSRSLTSDLWPLTSLPSPLLPLTLSALILLFPLMGFTIPWRRALTPPAGQTVRILTCNLCGRQPALANVLQDSNRLSVDVVCLQECPPDIPPKWGEGWNFVRHGQIAIASKHPIADVQVFRREHPPTPWPPVIAVVARVRHPDRNLRVASVHLTTPRPAISDLLDRQTGVAPSRRLALVELIAVRREESRALAAWLGSMPDLDAIAGDFNMPTDSRILRHFWDPHYTNAFSTVGLGLGHTKHTPVGPLTYGLRIDHIFVNHKNSSQNHKKNLPRPENNNAGNAPNFPSKNTPIRSQVAPTVGSDHLPLWADLN